MNVGFCRILALSLLSVAILFSGCAKKFVPKADDGLNVYKFEGKYGYEGYLNGHRKIIEPQFDFAWPFSDDLAVVELNNRQGYINTNGDFVIEPRFDRAYEFSEGLARVKIGSKYGYINKEGKLVIGLEFDDASMFRNGTARVHISNQVGIIDTSGRFVSNEMEQNFQGKRIQY